MSQDELNLSESDSGESWKIKDKDDDLTDLENRNDGVRFVHDGKTMILGVRQNPEQARMIGLTGKDRRPIDPPPILELICLDDQGNRLE